MEPYTYVLNAVTSFNSQVHSLVKGNPPKELVQHNHKMYAKYREDIRATAPLFIPLEDRSRLGLKTYLLAEVYEEDKLSSFPRALGTEGMYLNDIRKHIQRLVVYLTSNHSSTIEFSFVSSRSRELPGYVPYSADEGLIQNFQEHWRTLSLKCFDSVHRALRERTDVIISHSFSNHPNLESEIRYSFSSGIAGSAN